MVTPPLKSVNLPLPLNSPPAQHPHDSQQNPGANRKRPDRDACPKIPVRIKDTDMNMGDKGDEEDQDGDDVLDDEKLV